MKPEKVTWVCPRCDTEITLDADEVPRICFKCGEETKEKNLILPRRNNENDK